VRPINIIQVDKPVFTHDGVKYSVEDNMYETFNQFQEEVDRAIDKGYSHCFIYYVGNQFDCKMISDISGEHTKVFIRSKFLKLD
jgi:hypothetical protein|tara:strand:- start:1139 stop:1390 length:252 start_codon:yes stop_codon:yes gene_type:complete